MRKYFLRDGLHLTDTQRVKLSRPVARCRCVGCSSFLEVLLRFVLRFMSFGDEGERRPETPATQDWSDL